MKSKKLRKSFLGIVLAVSLFPTSVFASNTTIVPAHDTPNQTINSYLTALKEQNISEVIELVIDERYETSNELKESYENMAQYKRNQITDYNVLEETPLSSEEVKYVVSLSAADGSQENTPFHLKKINDDWKVIIQDGDITEDPSYMETKPATEEETVKANIQLSQENVTGESLQIMANQLMDYNWWNRIEGKTFYSNQSFDFSKNQLMLNFRQWWEDNGVNKVEANVTLRNGVAILHGGLYKKQATTPIMANKNISREIQKD
ncbi:DUF4878 domain-containing protein [Paenibacillus apiarius]|uniref:DUF4878 domain-containing protein n=2 Tax=Paenibacillus apiarius TaxID=46240 RepID=UPI00197DE527|nr:DUF4878 domain-containing protein [Paenibacillus apiarius]MBN3527033.1 DUF4878 domain-containing protein [Paenibacillus apiarius]